MMADGHLNKCKECTKKDSIDRRWRDIDKAREYDRSRGNRQSPGYLKEYRAKNPDKYKAHNAVSNGIRDGKLKKGKCSVCGTDKRVHAHHHDYRKPLDVVWLCSQHHSQLHRDMKK
jgi:hypothetical protein